MNLYDKLQQQGMWRSVLCPELLHGLLSGLTPRAGFVAHDSGEDGELDVAAAIRPLPMLDFQLALPGGPLAFRMRWHGLAGARTAFRVAIGMPPAAAPVLRFIQTLPGHVLTAATRKSAGDQTWLEALPPPAEVQLKAASLWLIVKGQAGGVADWVLSEKADPPDGLIRLWPSPPTVLIGGTGLGLDFGAEDDLRGGLWLDLSSDAVPGPATMVDGQVIARTPADEPAWRGVAARSLQVLLPKGVPFIGGHPVSAHLQMGLAPTAGIDLLVLAKVPPKNDRPGLDVRIECRDPTAQGVAGFVPTLIEAVMELPWPRQQPAEGSVPSLRIGGGKPVRARARFTRSPQPAGASVPPSMQVSLALESQGDDGLLKVDGRAGGPGEKAVVTAATLTTALAADGQGPLLHTLLTAAVGLSAFLESGQVVLHRVELLSTGGHEPVGGPVKLRLDYSVDALVQSLAVGVLSVEMKPNQPLKIRVRDVVLTVDPESSGLKMFSLDVSAGAMEVQDPGGWRIKGPESLFDVLGTRSGRGSLWIEVDLRFRLDMGPVKISGATIRGTLDPQGRPKAELRGLVAGVELKHLVHGTGGVQLTEGGFHAHLAVNLPPLGNLGAAAAVHVLPPLTKLCLAVSFPGPLPLANSGLGLYAVAGTVALNGKPVVQAGSDQVAAQLDWDPFRANAFAPARGQFTFGAQAVIGTLPDMGFTFSAAAGLFLTLPSVAVRGAVEGRYLAPRVTLPRSAAPVAGGRVVGAVAVDPDDAVLVAVEGSYRIPKLLEVVVPVAARFPIKVDKHDWFIHVGADGWRPSSGERDEQRSGGPARAVFLPGLIDQQVDAYLMFRGHGITRWPRGGRDALGPPITVTSGFVCAFGVGFNAVWGLKPIVWVEIAARADALLTPAPLTVVAMGRIGGNLNIGPFSVGVEARLRADIVEPHAPALRARVCGRVDLLLTTLERCVDISVNAPPLRQLPPLPQSPLLDEAWLLDEGYAHVRDGADPQDPERPGERKPQMHASREAALAAPPVWPDAVPLLTFAWAPELELSAASPFHDHAKSYPEGPRAVVQGSDMLSYRCKLLDVRLVDCTDAAVDAPVAGPLSAAWLKPKAGKAAEMAQPAELALLTPHSELWLETLAEGGAGLPGDPLSEHIQICRVHAQPERGQAWGALAEAFSQSGPGLRHDAWRLPPRVLSPDACVSRFSATLEVACAGGPLPAGALSEDLLRLADLPWLHRPAQLIDLAQATNEPLDIEGAFALEALQLPGILAPNGLPVQALGLGRTVPQLSARLTPSAVLSHARLWLLVDDAPTEEPGFGPALRVDGDDGVEWVLDASLQPGQPVLADGRRVQAWQPPVGTRCAWVEMKHRPGLRLAIIALTGLTDAAMAAADARNQAAADAAAIAAATREAGPAPVAGANGSTRHVLGAGRVYRVDVDMSWSGRLDELDDNSQRRLVEEKLDEPLPRRSFWFRTAPAGASDQLGESGQRAYALAIFSRRDFFQPLMLRRFLRATVPAQSPAEIHRFAADPLRIHMGISHAAALADAYGWRLEAECQRSDVPLSAGAAARVKRPRLSLAWPGSTAFMPAGQAALFEAVSASPCMLPPPGGLVAQAAPRLAPLCWYDLSLVARQKGGGSQPQTITKVSFRTSRWRDAPALLQGLGFGRSLPGEVAGDVDVGTATWPVTALDATADDAVFDDLLARLGLDGRAEVSAPRLSLLWRVAGTVWECSGLFIESPEPLHRPGRLHVLSLDLVMGAAGAAVHFDSLWRDRSGTRLVLATTTPFVPRITRQGAVWRRPRLRMRCRDLRPAASERNLQGWLWLREQPGFAGELL